MHRDYYNQWVRLDTTPDQLVGIHAIDPATGEKLPEYDLQKESLATTR